MKTHNADKFKPTTSFVEYCWSFYGPGEIYGDFFKHGLTKQELIDAIRLYLRTKPNYAGDSVDRERVRDILLQAKGQL